jgi:hypothetical protein
MAGRDLFLGNPPERMEIHFSRKKQITLFFLGLLMAIGCGFAAYASCPGDVNVKIIVIRFAMPAIYFKSIMVFGACFFSLLPIMIIKRAINKVPLAILDAEGIKLTSLKGLTIKWQDISSYECYTTKSHEFIGFNVHDPASYVKNLSFLKRKLMSLNRKTGFYDFAFMISKEDKQDILHMFHHHLGM